MPNVTNNFPPPSISLVTIPHIPSFTSTQLSPDASMLLVYNITTSLLSQPVRGEVQVYNVNPALNFASFKGKVRIDETAYGSQATFTGNTNIVLVETREMEGSMLYSFDIEREALNPIRDIRAGGTPQLFADGNVYMSQSQREDVLVFDKNLGFLIAFTATNRILTGTLSQSVYRPKAEATEQPYPVYSRVVGQKQYELKDHLGNVRALVSDVKTLATPAAKA
jgi:hypothetical protein